MNLTICLVAYSQKFTETVSFYSLLNLTKNLKENINLYIFDNGSEDFSSSHEELDTHSFHSLNYIYNKQKERGTRIAYQSILDVSQDEWLMFLDDDTEISQPYLSKILSEIKKENQSDICAYAPLVFDHEIQISPTASDTLKMINFPKKPGIYSENLTGISSCLVVKSDLLIEIGGLNIEYPLDYLDHWLFWKIFNSNKKVVVINEKINHHLSIQEINQTNDLRFYSIFSSEDHFYKYYKPELLLNLYKKYVRMIIKGILGKEIGPRWKILLKILLERK